MNEDIKKDVLKLKYFEELSFDTYGKYFSILPTPKEIPSEGSDTGIEWIVAEDGQEILFYPLCSDYQFEVVVWKSVINYPKEQFIVPTVLEGYKIIARRSLGEGVIEVIEYGEISES